MKILVSIALALVCQFDIFAQCDHTSNSKKRFEAMRLLPPITVRAFNGSLIEYTYEDRLGIYVGSFELQRETEIPKDFGATYKKNRYWALFSSCDNYLYILTPLTQEQLKALK